MRIYIACQTLHLFLTEKELSHYNVISLLELTKASLAKETRTLKVIASKTSRESNLHGNWLNCPLEYVEAERTDHSIEAILRGLNPDVQWAEKLAQENPCSWVVPSSVWFLKIKKLRALLTPSYWLPTILSRIKPDNYLCFRRCFWIYILPHLPLEGRDRVWLEETFCLRDSLKNP